MVILNSILMMVFERIREFGIMKAIGFKPQQVIVLVLWETFVMTVLATFLGVALAYCLNIYMVEHGIDLSAHGPNGFDFSGTTIEPIMRSIADSTIYVKPILLLFLVTMVSGLYPAIRAARLEVVSAIYGHH
jgi:ABC-type antimicrobial peptide transport system permease subunit